MDVTCTLRPFGFLVFSLFLSLVVPIPFHWPPSALLVSGAKPGASLPTKIAKFLPLALFFPLLLSLATLRPPAAAHHSDVILAW